MRWTLASLAGGTALAAIVAAAPAHAQSGTGRYVSPYIELTQVATADLSNGDDDLLTYTQVAVGVDAGIYTQRTEAQVSYRYERRFAWNDDFADDEVHSGLARAAVQVGNGLTLEGGAIATRARADIRGAAPGVLAGDPDNVTQVYSLYAGPTLATNVGAVQIGGAYRFGYTKVEVPNSIDVGPGQQPLDYFDDSTGHVAQLSAGVAAGDVLPVGITVSGAYEREDAGQLDQSYEGKYVRGDVVLPLSRTVAIRGGIGYEKIEAKQRDALVDATGNPVLDRNGRFVTDPASPERIAYNTDGLIYDAGVIWKPNARLELQANAGWRYGNELYTGSLVYQMDRSTGMQLVVYNGIETFGRQLRRGLEDLPTGFQTQPDPFGQQFSGCVFGSRPGEGGLGVGGCLNDAFQSITASSYRARGIDGVVATVAGRTSYGFGGGYAFRRLYAPVAAPGITVIGTEDESVYGQFFWSRTLNATAAVDANVFVNYYESGLRNSPGVFGAGATGTYSQSFGRLGTIASLGVYTYDQQGLDDQWSAQALLGARYQF